MLSWLPGEVKRSVELNLKKADPYSFSSLIFPSPSLPSLLSAAKPNLLFLLSHLPLPFSPFCVIASFSRGSRIHVPPVPLSLPSLLSAAKPNLYTFSYLIFPSHSLFAALCCQITGFSRGPVLSPPFPLFLLPLTNAYAHIFCCNVVRREVG
jgi:hypothetical protein